MLVIDGSRGEGGGQILRTSVALSAVTESPLRVINIRANRSNPGLRAQHVNAINAVAELCNARVKTVDTGSKEIGFYPGKIKGGNFNVDIGTAGSITLLLQAFMIPAAFADKRVRIRIRGGTDVRWSPPIDYLRYVTLPVLEKFNYRAEIELGRRGYYPKGGGRVKATIHPIEELRPVEMVDWGNIKAAGGVAHAHSDLEKNSVARRQAKASRSLVYKKLANMHYEGNIEIKQEYDKTLSYGSGITLWVETDNSIIGADSLGARDKIAESVGSEAAVSLIREIDSGAPLDRYMADQIVPYLALAGGKVRVSQVTGHTRTNIDIVNKFGFNVKVKGDIIEAARPQT